MFKVLVTCKVQDEFNNTHSRSPCNWWGIFLCLIVLPRQLLFLSLSIGLGVTPYTTTLKDEKQVDSHVRGRVEPLQPALYFPHCYILKQGGVYPLGDKIFITDPSRT